MPDPDLLARIRRFEHATFPRYEQVYRRLVDDGQHPGTLFIGCSDSRIVPHLLMDCGPGELFIVRNVGAFVPPHDASHGHHGTAAAIEFAVLSLQVRNIVVCGHSHCGAIGALYREPPEEAHHMRAWLDLARPAALPVMGCDDALRRVEQRSVVLQLEHLLTYPMVRRRVESGELFVHGWHYLIDEGRILVFDFESGRFVPHGDVAPADGSNAAGADAAGSNDPSPERAPLPVEVDVMHWAHAPHRPHPFR